MIKRSSQVLTAWFLACDLAVTALAWVGAYYLRFSTGWIPVFKPTPDAYLCLRNLPLVLLLSVLSYRLAGQYAIHRLRRFREEMIAVLKGAALLALFLMATIFLLQDPYESRASMLLFVALTAGGMLFLRRLSWMLVRYLRSRGFNQTHAVIVGTGRTARKIARTLRRLHWIGIKNLGFVEDQPNRWTSDLDILGTTADLPRIIEKYQVEHVFIALPMSRYHEARRVFDALAQTLAEVRLVADVPNLAGLSLTTTNIDGLPVIGLRESPHFGLNVVVKRAMDIALSLLALVILWPSFSLFLPRLFPPGTL